MRVVPSTRPAYTDTKALAFNSIMDFIPIGIQGAFLVRLKKIKDERGYFARGWCSDEFTRAGLAGEMPQLNTAYTRLRGTLRGLHFQLPPHAEAKLVRCTCGTIWDVLVDLRPDSPTHGRAHGVTLSAESGEMLYIPEGCAHGYQTLCDHAEMYYMSSKPYAPSFARGVCYDDVAFRIDWPLPVTVISDADRNWPAYHSTCSNLSPTNC
jgi:dTDP-4-dehydrorhamnose 3,5-epimerase